MKMFVASIIGLFAAQTALAAGSVTAHVINVRIDQSGKGIVFFDQNLAGSPTCIQPTYENALAFDTSTAGGRAIMARALAAKASGDLIKVVGTGTCTIYGNAWAEDWLYGDSSEGYADDRVRGAKRRPCVGNPPPQPGGTMSIRRRGVNRHALNF